MGLCLLERITMKIVQITNEHPDFYRLIGPFLSRREIAKEMKGPIWDDDGKIWFVAFVENEVAGFATMIKKPSAIQFEEAYVLPSYREQGIHNTLIQERVKHCPEGTTIQVLIFKKALPEYLSRGFQLKKEVGKQYAEVMKVVEV